MAGWYGERPSEECPRTAHAEKIAAAEQLIASKARLGTTKAEAPYAPPTMLALASELANRAHNLASAIDEKLAHVFGDDALEPCDLNQPIGIPQCLSSTNEALDRIERSLARMTRLA